MISVFKHELKLYSHNFVTYAFCVLLLFFVGVGSLLYNLTQSYANFEYALSAIGITLIVLVPILTMRVMAEEKKQKTDQLLYSLPISAAGIVVGKFLALAVVLAMPMIVVCAYPIMFSGYGDVYLPISYSSILAFFFLGLSCLSIGEFVSSLTESQGVACGIGVAVLLFNYFSATLADYVSSTSLGAFIAILVAIALLALVVRLLTKSTVAALIAAVIPAIAIVIAYLCDATILENLLPDLLHELSLFERFETFVDGVFDIKVLIYDLSVIVFFLFLTVQSVEKRRYN